MRKPSISLSCPCHACGVFNNWLHCASATPYDKGLYAKLLNTSSITKPASSQQREPHRPVATQSGLNGTEAKDFKTLWFFTKHSII